MADKHQWEYLWVTCRSEDGVDVVYRINGEDLADTQKQKAVHFLEAAGVGGWELVGVAEHGSPRPRAGGQVAHDDGGVEDFRTSLWFKRKID